jgi:hypothetical protein
MAEEKNTIYESQNRLCGNDGCRRPMRSLRVAFVDRDATGRIRGVLCPDCNSALRHLDDAIRIRGLATYLEKT